MKCSNELRDITLLRSNSLVSFATLHNKINIKIILII